MNLPYPFDNASGVQTNLDGSINLIDHQGNTLARIPLATAFELSPEVKGHGYGDSYGEGGGFGDGYGDGDGERTSRTHSTKHRTFGPMFMGRSA